MVRKTLEENAAASLRKSAFHVFIDIDQLFYERMLDMEMLSASLSGVYNGAVIGKIFRDFRSIYPAYKSLDYFDSDDIKVASTTGKYIGERFRFSKRFSPLEGDSRFIMGADILDYGDKEALYFVKYVRDVDGEKQGFLIARMMLGVLHELISARFLEGDKALGAKVDLANKDGLVIFSNYDESLVLDKTAPAWNLVNAQIRKGKRHGSGINDNYLYVFYAEPGYEDFKGNDWVMILRQPMSAVIKPVNEMLKKTVMIFAFTAILGLLAIYLFALSVSIPIEQLSKAANAVSKGEYNVNLRSASNDEVGKLVNSFAKMAGDLKSYKEYIDSYSSNLSRKIFERTQELSEVNKKLQKELEEHRRAQEELGRAKEDLETKVMVRTSELSRSNELLLYWTKELERNNKELDVLRQMVEILQSCMSFNDAYPVIAQFAHRLYPQLAGVLYLYNPSKTFLEAVVSWGGRKPSSNIMINDDCCALKFAKHYFATDEAKGLRCKHMGDEKGAYLCVPLGSENDIIGVVNFSALKENSFDVWGSEESRSSSILRFSERLGVSLSRLKLMEKLQEYSIKDSLTGLFNRRFMEQSLELEIQRAKRNKASLGILMFDLDHFKEYNDTLGHEAGDNILRKVGDFVLKKIRGSDVACRYGGDEFIIILPEASRDASLRFAEFVASDIKNMDFKIGESPGKLIGISAGVAVFPKHGDTAHELLVAADKALYSAKRAGRGRVVVAKKGSA